MLPTAADSELLLSMFEGNKFRSKFGKDQPQQDVTDDRNYQRLVELGWIERSEVFSAYDLTQPGHAQCALARTNHTAKQGIGRIVKLLVGETCRYPWADAPMAPRREFTIEKIEGCVVYGKSASQETFVQYADPAVLP